MSASAESGRGDAKSRDMLLVPGPATSRLFDFVQDLARSPAPEGVLRSRDGRTVLRSRFEGESLIFKFWQKPGLRGHLGRLSRQITPAREWGSLTRLRAIVPSVPRPIAYFHLRVADSPYTDALVVEDVGEKATDAVAHVKALLAQERLDQVGDVEKQLIDITEALVLRRMVDIDHRLPNFLVNAEGMLVRIDFEHCVHLPLPVRMHPARYGMMLGTLIGSYTFAVQPEVQRAEAFAWSLAERLRPPRRILSKASEVVDRMLNRQHRKKGIETRLDLTW